MIARPNSHLVIASIMAMLPIVSYATACGGLDNTWDESSEVLDGYVESVWNALAFENGEIYERSYETSQTLQVVRDAHTLRLIGEKGTYLFKHGDRLLHRRADITFITHPDSQLSDEGDIYHELLMEGTFEAPPAREEKQANAQKATLVVQGLGNACLDSQAFNKWILDVKEASFVVWGKLKPNRLTLPASIGQ